jgi:plastocyanin
MRRAKPLAGLAAVAILVAACAGSAPGWTYAPAPPATPVPSVDASGQPSAEPSGSTADVFISAVNIAFDQTEVTAPADREFTIEFANNDSGVPHNVEIKDDAGTSLYKGEIFNGVATQVYEVPALAAGAYPFTCTVHPSMTGTLTAS